MDNQQQCQEALLPCPFCNGNGFIDAADGSPFWVTCTGCNGDGPTMETVSDAITAWNRRPPAAQPVDAEHADHLRRIIAAAYQIAGCHDVPARILDVLSDPDNATEAQIEAMLPYQFDSDSRATAAAEAMKEAAAKIVERHVGADAVAERIRALSAPNVVKGMSNG